VRVIQLILLLIPLMAGCVYKMGAGLTAGMLDEASGKGRTEGVEGLAEDLLAAAVLTELGHQLGEGLMSGATDITPEQRAKLELAIDGALTVAATRTAAGLRDEVSPQLREMVRQDIVETLAEGMRGELGSSMEETVDRVVTRAVRSLEQATRDPVFREALAAMIRESTYQALREGRPGSPGVGETLETTLSENLLTPFETSIGGLAETVADRVDQSAKRTERTLQGVISALVIILGVIVLLYVLTRRQLFRAREHSQETEMELRTMGAALDQLDPRTRDRLLGKLDEYKQVTRGQEPPSPRRKDEGRSSEYERKDR
jgi:hypothetical protein